MTNITEIIAQKGEEYFRDGEYGMQRDASSRGGRTPAPGGGALCCRRDREALGEEAAAEVAASLERG